MLGLCNLENTFALWLRFTFSHRWDIENGSLGPDLRNGIWWQHTRQGPLKNDPFRIDKKNTHSDLGENIYKFVACPLRVNSLSHKAFKNIMKEIAMISKLNITWIHGQLQTPFQTL